MPHVFISYVRQNRDVVDRLAKELRSRSVTVWLDRNDIEPGARWKLAIKRAIRSGKFFLACFSVEYNQREETHMNEELTLAIDEIRRRPSDRKWFIPVIINKTRIPERMISSLEDLSDINAINLYDNWDEGISKLVRVLQYDDPVLSYIWHLVDVLHGPIRGAHRHAIEQLGELEASEKPVIAALINATKDDDPEIRPV